MLTNELILDSAAKQVADEWARNTLNYNPDKHEYIVDWLTAESSLHPDFDPFMMLQFELMAQGMRKLNGFNKLPE